MAKAKTVLTDKEIKAAIASGGTGWLSQSLGSRQGSLCLRYWPTGRAWYFAYNAGGKTKRLVIEPDASTGPNLTLAQARLKATDLAKERRDAPEGDLIAHRKTTAAAVKHKARLTLNILLAAYVEDLRQRGKSSAKSVEMEFRRLLTDYPDLEDREAATITPDEWASILRRYGLDDGTVRKMQKIRAYVRAAYKHASSASLNPLAKASTTQQINVNPLTSIPPGPASVRNRALSETEFRAFWKIVTETDHPIARSIEAMIRMGGQRFSQLARSRLTDYVDGTLVLWDAKGRRTEPRRHVLPVRGCGKALLDALGARSMEIGSEWLFTVSGANPIDLTAASRFVTDVSRRMVRDGAATSPFRMMDIRRSLETHLADMGVHKDIRAQLQSHGLGGVQDRHYDKSEYTQQKIDALAKLERWLSQESGTVVALRAGGAA